MGTLLGASQERCDPKNLKAQHVQIGRSPTASFSVSFDGTVSGVTKVLPFLPLPFLVMTCPFFQLLLSRHVPDINSCP